MIQCKTTQKWVMFSEGQCRTGFVTGRKKQKVRTSYPSIRGFGEVNKKMIIIRKQISYESRKFVMIIGEGRNREKKEQENE